MKYAINGIDFADLGVTVQSGVPSVLTPPKRKQPYTYNFPDANGLTGDLSEIFTGERIIELDCIIQGNSGYDLKNKFQDFVSRFTKPDLQKLECFITGTEHYVFYNEISNLTQQSKGAFYNGVLYTFTLSLTEPQPGVTPVPYTTPTAAASSSGFVYTSADGTVYTL